MGLYLPKSVAQLTGVLVTAIVAFGTDVEVYYAIPMGIFAGALATLFVSLSDSRQDYDKRWDARDRRKQATSRQWQQDRR
jgi:hypothetical protein